MLCFEPEDILPTLNEQVNSYDQPLTAVDLINLGHATAAFTLDRYGHMTEQMKKASSERMEQFIRTVSGS